MLNTDNYEVLKSSLIQSQRLFDKLNNVSTQYEELELDESGLYIEDEEILERHWLKLSSKIIDSLNNALESYNIELLQNSGLEIRKLFLNLIQDDEKSKVEVDYSEADALSISQIS